jgi:aconitase A
MDTGFVTGTDPQLESAIKIATRRGNDQQDTIDRFNNMSGLDWVVNAEAVTAPNGTPVWAYARCADDTAHGSGTVVIAGHDMLCPDCAEQVVRAELVVDARIDVGVLL